MYITLPEAIYSKKLYYNKHISSEIVALIRCCYWFLVMLTFVQPLCKCQDKKQGYVNIEALHMMLLFYLKTRRRESKMYLKLNSMMLRAST